MSRSNRLKIKTKSTHSVNHVKILAIYAHVASCWFHHFPHDPNWNTDRNCFRLLDEIATALHTCFRCFIHLTCILDHSATLAPPIAAKISHEVALTTKLFAELRSEASQVESKEKVDDEPCNSCCTLLHILLL